MNLANSCFKLNGDGEGPWELRALAALEEGPGSILSIPLAAQKRLQL